MKILVARRGKGALLLKELSNYDSLVVTRTRKVRINRRSQKMVEKTYWVMADTIFCQIDDFSSLTWLKRVWTKDGKYVEVDRKEVERFMSNTAIAAKEPAIIHKIGDLIPLTEGLFAGFNLEVTGQKGNLIKGFVRGENGLCFPLALEWLTHTHEYAIKSSVR